MKKEQNLIDSIASILLQKMEKDYARGEMERSAHPKNLGLLKATFSIEKNVPPGIAKGLFSTPKTYPCLLRLSSTDAKVQSDKEKDFRGLAIKLVGVEGKRFKDFEKQTQDFVLMSYPIMPLGTLQLFHDVIVYSIKLHPLLFLVKLVFSGNLGVLTHFKRAKQHHSSSLDICYWSTRSTRLGDGYVKFSVTPTSLYHSELPAVLTDDYLSENNAAHLLQHEASFDFLVQQFKNEKETPIENAGIEWSEQVSPFLK